jgi:hypothetical protein
MVGLIRPLNESDQKNNFLWALCALKRATGAGERNNKPSFPHRTAWIISIAEGLMY